MDDDLIREARRIDDSLELDLPQLHARRIVVEVRALTVVKILAVMAGAYLLVQVWPLIILLVISLMLAAALAPFLALIQRTGLSRGWALSVLAIMIVGGFFVVLGAVVPPLVFQTRDLLSHSDQYVRSLQTVLAEHGVHRDLLRLWHSVPKRLSALDATLVQLVFGILDSVVAMATVLFVTLYVLSDQERLKCFFVGLFPSGRRADVLAILAELRRQVGGYVRGQLITSVLAMVFSFIVMTLAGVPNAIPLAVFVGIADLIPMFGGLIGTTPPVLIALTISLVRAIVVLLGFVLYQNLENHLIAPRVYSNTMSVSSLVALVGVLVGAKLLGMLGMLVALPLVAALPVLLDFVGIHLNIDGRPAPAVDASKDLEPTHSR